jgi:hypothetical protein
MNLDKGCTIMIIVEKMDWFGGACPTQGEGWTANHEAVYVRFRWGNLRVTVNDRQVFYAQLGEDQNDEEELEKLRKEGKDEVYIEDKRKMFKMMRECSGRICWDGHISYEELKEVTKNEIQWPEIVTDLH